MTPQFVDFNNDGHTDILCATFDGSPHVALGSEAGFLEPEHVLDSDGKRVMLSQFWNYESEQWDDTGDEPEAHCTSALAYDWDDDGDLDLLMGDYKKGYLFLRKNTGEPKAPTFDSANIRVQVDGEDFLLVGGLASMQLIDWDGDGLEDLLCGGYGDAYGQDLGAGIVWCKNTGERGAPRFAAPQTLIERSQKGTRTAVRPDSGLHLEAVDWDGDGLLDLLVGGYSHWAPEARSLTADEEQRALELQALSEQQSEALQALYAEMLAGYQELTKEEQEAASTALIESSEYKQLREEMRKTSDELDVLRPGAKREGSVWVYRREK